MKYIRTKNGIHNYINDDEFRTQNFMKRGYKIADTIEELCDELVFVFKHSLFSNHCEVWHLYHEYELKDEIYNALFDGYRADEDEIDIIYGAIWTDKGLIYVAKMNEKGELELL